MTDATWRVRPNAARRANGRRSSSYMTRTMLIDASHPEETRVVVVKDRQLQEFDYESATKKQLKGNIYLAKVTRVEPSLQAAFVDYGGQRHGFLAFSEIHPDYYQIPQADRRMLEEAVQAEQHAAEAAEPEPAASDGEAEVEAVTTDPDEEAAEDFAEQARRRQRLLRSYKIQEVIKRRQILLVQVVKEERGNKGAALTTYLSLAGRYCVLMPNTARGGGISRKIANAKDRQRLKTIARELDVPQGMGLIIRTAGQSRNKQEIRRDYDYLMRLWSDIRERTLASIAPCTIHEEGALVKRAIRDLYDRDIEDVMVEGEDAFRAARKIMGMLMPSRIRKVKQYKEELPLFHRYEVENQLDALHQPVVELKSGGSIVIHTTEALTAIDVNSGRATRERNIEETALKTNLEAADEVARQLRLRDLAGLIVVDFIDMAEMRNQRAVERRFRDALKYDRARVQLGRISAFGLLELSRQRLRPSLLELSAQPCPTCAGSGAIRSTESAALQALRRVELEGMKGLAAGISITLPLPVALYFLNQKRDQLVSLEQRYQMKVEIRVGHALIAGQVELEVTQPRDKPVATVAEEAAAVQQPAAPAAPAVAAPPAVAAAEAGEEEDGQRKRRRRRRRRRRGGEGEAAELLAAREPLAADEDEADEVEGEPLAAEAEEALLPVAALPDESEPAPAPVEAEPAAADAAAPAEGEAEAAEERPARRRRRTTRTPRTRRRKDAEEAAEPAAAAPGEAAAPPVPTDAPVEWRLEEEPVALPAPAAAEAPLAAAEPAIVADTPPPPAAEKEGAAEPTNGHHAEPVAEAARDDEDDAITPADLPLAAMVDQSEQAEGPPRRGWWSRFTRKPE
jgi:ribonuclease E